ncbi:hypothetical protein V5F77_04435 [Xanthobacter sp. DSM 24535]|uniref:hypothetical protein n=1 Tax=Roseixanthobacter psychrophilus TaxID=3119917 RepID=UPI003726C2C5
MRNVGIDLMNNGQRMDAVVAVPVMTEGGNISANATGAAFVIYGAQACSQITIAAPKSVDVEVQQDGAGLAFPVYAGTYMTFFGLTNASQLGVRRVDQTAVAVAVIARWEQ